MDNEDYKAFVESVKVKVLKDGRPLYKLAPIIGINDCTLKKFLTHGNVNVYTVLQIANYFNMKLFAR